MPFLRILIDKQYFNEFQAQAFGLVSITFGLFMGGIGLQFNNIYVFYILCTIPCGFGGLCAYQRLVFIHQIWFKSLNKQNLGAGVFGFAIGFWTILFFLLSIPILQALPVHSVLYVYAAICPFAIGYPCYFAKDIDSTIMMQLSTTLNENEVKDENIFVSPTTTEYNDHVSNIPSLKEVIEIGSDKTHSYTNDEGKEENNEIIDNTHVDMGDDIIDDDGNDEDHSQNCFTYFTCFFPAVNQPKGVTSPKLLHLAILHNIDIDSNGEFDLTYTEILTHPMVYNITLFFTIILTPGWGIKLASLAILHTMFHTSTTFAIEVTAIYITLYALGRLFSGILAEFIGAYRTYDVLIGTMLVCLVLAPQTANYLSTTYGNSGGGTDCRRC